MFLPVVVTLDGDAVVKCGRAIILGPHLGNAGIPSFPTVGFPIANAIQPSPLHTDFGFSRNAWSLSLMHDGQNGPFFLTVGSDVTLPQPVQVVDSLR